MDGFVLVVGNGAWEDPDMVLQLVEDADFVIALDGAADRFDGWDIVVGDMDSIEDPSPHKACSNQENSDLSKALEQYEVDAVVGVEGGRLDHAIGAFTSLFENQSNAILYYDGWRACIVTEEGLNIDLESGVKCSVMPFGKVSKVTLTGCEYSLDNEDLNSGTRGIGNSALGGEINISHQGGDLLFIWEANAL